MDSCLMKLFNFCLQRQEENQTSQKNLRKNFTLNTGRQTIKKKKVIEVCKKRIFRKNSSVAIFNVS